MAAKERHIRWQLVKALKLTAGADLPWQRSRRFDPILTSAEALISIQRFRIMPSDISLVKCLGPQREFLLPIRGAKWSERWLQGALGRNFRCILLSLIRSNHLDHGLIICSVFPVPLSNCRFASSAESHRSKRQTHT